MSFAELFLSEIAAYEQTGDGSVLKKIVLMLDLLRVLESGGNDLLE